jgi:putative transposase
MIWSTFNRDPWLDDSVRLQMWEILRNIASSQGVNVIEINGFHDHVHILARIPAKYVLSQVVQTLKSLSTREIAITDPTLRAFQWQSGYGAYSVSKSKQAVVAAYIQNQEAHHSEDVRC